MQSHRLFKMCLVALFWTYLPHTEEPLRVQQVGAVAGELPKVSGDQGPFLGNPAVEGNRLGVGPKPCLQLPV